MNAATPTTRRSIAFKGALLGLGVFVAMAAAAVWVAASDVVPDCAGGKDTLHGAFNGSPLARQGGLSVVESTGHSQLTWDERTQTRVCSAALRLNSSAVVSAMYRMEGRKDGTFLLTYELLP